jgi:pyruvate carboxylase subunit B
MKEKELHLDINGKEYSVVIHEFNAYEAVVSVNDKRYTVGLKDLGVDQVSDVKPVRTLEPGEPNTEQAYHSSPPRPRSPQSQTPATQLHRPSSLVNTKTVVAPLPGLIQKIYVRQGDTVKSGQPVLMLEAMKMENEIPATMDGVIKDIRCREGESVNQGQELIVMETGEE